jgi:RNA polymerase sigma-70 factor (ECF subfamily)
MGMMSLLPALGRNSAIDRDSAMDGNSPIDGNTEMSEAPGSIRYDAVTLSSEQQNRFVSENQRRVFLLIYRMVGNVDDAQDLTQESFIKALQRHDQLKDLDKAAHWLLRIASNTAIDFLRRSGRVSFSGIDEVPEPVAISRAESPEQLVLRAERREHLEAGLAVLTDRERTALLLRDVEDMPAEEVAARLNCSKATVRSHIANARVKFRRYLERAHSGGSK